MLKMFLDGSGKSDASNERLTLAGLIAHDDVWKDLEARWAEVLKQHNCPYLHMRELLRGSGPYKGWSDDAKRALVVGLFNTLPFQDRRAVIATSLTIDLAAHRSLAAAGPHVKPAAAVCVDSVMTILLNHPSFLHGGTEVYFDQGEDFRKHLERIWSRKKSDKDSWAHLMALKSGDKSAVGVQAADLVGWSANRYYRTRNGTIDFWTSGLMSSIIMVEYYHKFYGTNELVNHPSFYAWDGPAT